ncbi:uncharacterized protein LOC9641988 [Selaginella moellendorffii]|nr:uncharacterized protein LOC9641988 [Selaginella moellendorffii]XP_024532106.1 uncharacterized protein LOC9641988 [Selaginella moellendorffii]|eukprot:XP_024532098.1 uncharacterized protein LOC9641988 [Selaginella moellendorffii]
MLSTGLGFFTPIARIHCARAPPTRRARRKWRWRHKIVTFAPSQIHEVSKDSPPRIGDGDGDGDGAGDDAPLELELTQSELPDIVSSGSYQVLQDDASIVSDFYTFLVKQDFSGFFTAMVAAPVMLSLIFTVLYVPAFRDLSYEDHAFRELTPLALFQIFMFSVSLCTGLEPEVSPISPYTMVLANVNALLAQLLFAFLSGAVFSRLSQPSRPIKCSSMAIISRERSNSSRSFRVLMARFVLTGPQPCELVDVKVELTLKYTALSKSGKYFRGMEPLKLVRKGCFYLNYGMLVRHVIDEKSPLYNRTPEMLIKADAAISLGVVGLERSSMQPVFHVQEYCAREGHIVWDAKFNDMILINKNKSVRIVDHSRLSSWTRQ